MCSTRVVSRSTARSTSPLQSAQSVLSMSSTVVPCPGRRGSSTSKPVDAIASAIPRTDDGVPVNPCTTSTPTVDPATCDQASHPARTPPGCATSAPTFIPSFLPLDQRDPPITSTRAGSHGYADRSLTFDYLIS